MEYCVSFSVIFAITFLALALWSVHGDWKYEKARADAAEQARDEARANRDTAQAQRDVARDERDTLRTDCCVLRSDVKAAEQRAVSAQEAYRLVCAERATLLEELEKVGMDRARMVDKVREVAQALGSAAKYWGEGESVATVDTDPEPWRKCYPGLEKEANA